MAHIAFFGLPASGHLNPTLPIVAELVRRGHKVTYTASKCDRAKVGATGAAFRAYEEMCPGFSFPERLLGVDSVIEVGARMLSVTEQLMPSVLRELALERPDVVVYDAFTLPARYAAERLQLKAVALVGTQMPAMKKGRPLLLPSARPRVLARMTVALLKGLGHVPAYRRSARALVEAYGISNPGLGDMLGNYGPNTIVFTSPEFQPGSEGLDDRFILVGPPLDADDRPADTSTAVPDGDAPLVYVSLGTLFNDDVRFFRQAVAAFRGRPVRVVISIGSRVSFDRIGDLPPNVTAVAYAPQLDLLRKSQVFVTHGGANSAREGLWFGVPLVVVPRGADQFFVAERVEELGLGFAIWSKRVTSTQLWSLVEKALGDQGMRKRCENMGESFRAAGGYRRAADAIERAASADRARLDTTTKRVRSAAARGERKRPRPDALIGLSK